MSGFGPDLDLSGILPSYKRFQPPEPEEKTKAEEPSGLKFLRPVLIGAWRGTERFSTCTDLDVPRIIKWDVNGYYRDLKVHPDATRRELMQAYLAANGQSSPRLTYCFKQLLNPEVRKAYDATPLGERFLDEYTQDELRKAAAREAFKRSQVGKAVSSEEVLEEWGFVIDDSEPPPFTDIDEPEPPRGSHARDRGNFPYKYWVCQTTEYIQDENKIGKWQDVLVSAASDLGIIREVAVGITGSSEKSCIVETSQDGHLIFYISENAEPTKALALEALRAVA